MSAKLTLDMRTVLGAVTLGALGVLASCGGGGTGTERDSGANKTYLRVEAADADGDTLSYQWRVTAGTVDNANARETVWTMPDGPGLHFAYVMVSDGRGGYAEQQYAVSTDALGTQAPVRAAVAYPAASSASTTDGTALRLRLGRTLPFEPAGSVNQRTVYLPDVAVRVSTAASGVVASRVVYSGTSDINGEVNLPQLEAASYPIECAVASGAPFTSCGSFTVRADRATVATVLPAAPTADNLRLHGHVSLGDEGVCGRQDAFFNVQTAATVQLLQSNGQALTAPRRVNRFGDYSIHAAVAVGDTTIVRIECGTDLVDIRLDPGSGTAQDSAEQRAVRAALTNSQAIERSHRFANRRPAIVRVVANGPEGNVRGRMVVEEPGAISNSLPGGTRFLSYKGTDTARSACMYYRSIGAVAGCDAQGRMVGAISFDDWKRGNQFAPYLQGNVEITATFINQRDLNLVRRMVATRKTNGDAAFYVCNNPGPERRSQAEVDEVITLGIAAERRVACVAMEWSTTPQVNIGGVNNREQPFTKFLTFGPDGSLIASVNLDGRGEKYMPGACVACHGGSRIGAKFPESGNPSPLLGARFLPFDTGNYLFSSQAGLSEASQQAAFYDLNQLVVATERDLGDSTATTRLVAGWYAQRTSPLNKAFVPGTPASATGWHQTTEKANFYREVIATSCRTCHTALGNDFDWDREILADRFGATPLNATVSGHVCGGTADLATNASMPNALASLNRLLVDNPAGSPLRGLMQAFLGCQTPAEDPVYRRR